MMEAEDIFLQIPGGRELMMWFGHPPDFHDAEIVSLCLNRRAPSLLQVHAWIMTEEGDEKRYYISDKHAVVTFILEDIIDLQMEGFSHQNVIYGLKLLRAPSRPDRCNQYALTPSPEDFEIQLEQCFGLAGNIRCRQISVEFVPGKPADSDFRASK